MTPENTIILALYPNARGLGYACIAMPQHLIEYGVVTISPVSNSKTLKRIEKFIDFLKPKIVLLKDPTIINTFKGARIKMLVEAIKTLSGEKALPIYQYSRDQVRDTFEQFGAVTKYQISQKILSWYPDLERVAPKIQKSWMNEDYYMGIFDALALAVTHQYVTE
jgi:Holliday junction resolvasome RuvABC endonuclease subunit